MNTKHTPGPWIAEGRTIYALMHNGWKKGVEQFKNRFYATVYFDSECPEEEAEANARLMAAAPDLLDALQEMIAIVEIHSEATDNDFAWAELAFAYAAIKKALGE